MTDPREPLADPTQERLTNPDEALRHHYKWRTQRPPAEFSPAALAIIWTAVFIGLALIATALMWAISYLWRIP